MPFINWTLLVAVVAAGRRLPQLRAISRGAYGIAVTLAMLIDSILIFVVMRRLWNWPLLASRSRSPLPLVLIDLAFLASNALKIPDGGWFPLADRRASCSRC